MRQRHCFRLAPDTGFHKIAAAVKGLEEEGIVIEVLWKHVEELDDEAVESAPVAYCHTGFAASFRRAEFVHDVWVVRRPMPRERFGVDT